MAKVIYKNGGGYPKDLDIVINRDKDFIDIEDPLSDYGHFFIAVAQIN